MKENTLLQLAKSLDLNIINLTNTINNSLFFDIKQYITNTINAIKKVKRYQSSLEKICKFEIILKEINKIENIVNELIKSHNINEFDFITINKNLIQIKILLVTLIKDLKSSK